MLNRLGDENLIHKRTPPPVTLPKLNLPDIDIELEAREAAARVAERRTIRRGLDAWAEINKAESFEGWLAIGAALAIGKAHALKVTGANAAWGRNYSREFICGSAARLRQDAGSDAERGRRACTSTPRRSPHGATVCPSASASGSFTRYRSHDAGEPLQRTTVSAHKTYGATPRPRGDVSVPV